MSEINQRSNLSTHCKSSAHLKRKEIKSKGSSFNENTFIDCGETIKLEDIKEEIRGEGNGDAPLSIHQVTENCNIFRDIKEKVKQEESVEDPLPIQEGKRRIKNDNICSEVKEEGIDVFRRYIIMMMKRITKLPMRLILYYPKTVLHPRSGEWERHRRQQRWRQGEPGGQEGKSWRDTLETEKPKTPFLGSRWVWC